MYYKYLVAGFVAAVVNQEYAPLRYGSVLLQVVVQVLPRLCRPVSFLLQGSQLMATHMIKMPQRRSDIMLPAPPTTWNRALPSLSVVKA